MRVPRELEIDWIGGRVVGIIRLMAKKNGGLAIRDPAQGLAHVGVTVQHVIYSRYPNSTPVVLYRN